MPPTAEANLKTLDVRLMNPGMFREKDERTFLLNFKAAWRRLPEAARITLAKRWADHGQQSPIVELYHPYGVGDEHSPDLHDGRNVSFTPEQDWMFFDFVDVSGYLDDDGVQLWVAEQFAHCYLRSTGVSACNPSSLRKWIKQIVKEWGFEIDEPDDAVTEQ